MIWPDPGKTPVVNNLRSQLDDDNPKDFEGEKRKAMPSHRSSSSSSPSPSPSWLSSLFAVLAILTLSVPVNALYFYMDGRQTKCFFEELPKDTLVVGMSVWLAIMDNTKRLIQPHC